MTPAQYRRLAEEANLTGLATRGQLPGVAMRSFASAAAELDSGSAAWLLTVRAQMRTLGLAAAVANANREIRNLAAKAFINSDNPADREAARGLL